MLTHNRKLFILTIAILALLSLAFVRFQGGEPVLAPSGLDENALVATAAVLLSAAFNWVPKLREWYTVQEDNSQKLIMLLAIALSAGLIFGASCTGFTIPGVTYSGTCDTAGAKQLGQLFVNGVVTSQIAYLVLPKPTPK